MVTAVEYGWYTIDIAIDGGNRQSLRLKVTRPPLAAAPVPDGIRIAGPDIKRH